MTLGLVWEAIAPCPVMPTDKLSVGFSLAAMSARYSLTGAVCLFPVSQIILAVRFLKNSVAPAAADGACGNATFAAAGIHQVCTVVCSASIGAAVGRGGCASGGGRLEMGRASRLAESGGGVIPIERLRTGDLLSGGGLLGLGDRPCTFWRIAPVKAAAECLVFLKLPTIANPLLSQGRRGVGRSDQQVHCVNRLIPIVETHSLLQHCLGNFWANGLTGNLGVGSKFTVR